MTQWANAVAAVQIESVSVCAMFAGLRQMKLHNTYMDHALITANGV